ncbi:hypothetical protein VitviT2T_013851 [Vitis vinifera]|uniref:Uncharacterized protein n=1 Tax=Vitis vinifera TaxID=29760 RepID=A0ABY9CIX3_VITVI|nr:hypothetical protein VitviT2T_013851 [Vitis vinifera]
MRFFKILSSEFSGNIKSLSAVRSGQADAENSNERSRTFKEPVSVDKQVNQAGRTNWQALLGFPGGHETQNCNGVVQNLNLVRLGGLLIWWITPTEFSTSSYSQAFVNGSSETYSPLIRNGSVGSGNLAICNGGAAMYSQAMHNGDID